MMVQNLKRMYCPHYWYDPISNWIVWQNFCIQPSTVEDFDYKQETSFASFVDEYIFFSVINEGSKPETHVLSTLLIRSHF